VRQVARLTLAGLLLALAVPAQAGDVKVSFSNGLVTILATDASPREILAEWARLGQVRVTNLDRLTGGPVTLQLSNVSETQALETVLRGTAGYVAAPRREAVTTLSRYDRILLMPGAAPALPVPGVTARPSINTGSGGNSLGRSPFGWSAGGEAGSGGPAPGFAPTGVGRVTGRFEPSRPAMPGQGMQTIVTAEPGDAPEQPAQGFTSSVPGMPAGQPGQAPVGAARPGEVTAKPVGQTPAGPIKIPD
jgi:hypothetical protein